MRSMVYENEVITHRMARKTGLNATHTNQAKIDRLMLDLLRPTQFDIL